MSEIEYITSTYPSKNSAYQSKKGNKGRIKLFISVIWKEAIIFDNFVALINFYQIMERYCLERCFQKIRIKGGMCNPNCCIQNITINTFNYLFEYF